MDQAQVQLAAAANAAAGGAGAVGVNVVAQAAADAVAAGSPAPGAFADALAAARQLANTQNIREQFSLAVAQTKAVLNPPLVIMLMLYPSVIAFTLAARYTKYSLLIPTPNAPNAAPPSPQLDHDVRKEWRTTTGEALACMVIFVVVTLIHCFLLTYMTLKGPKDTSPRMAPPVAWIAPVVFWFSTTLYFFVYTIMARYGIAWQEWVTFGVATGVLLFPTGFMIRALSLKKVVNPPRPQNNADNL
ncbi:unnamed protein product [Urochloa decumbens]|uniref:Uncharacterized protein n=1 Tax=Urochloa decumbens TaxID=240449 RepID=A0ABC9G1S5_9POAL